MLHTRCYMLHATCYMLSATCFMLHGTRYIPHATCYIPHATCYMLHASCYMSHTTCYVLNTTGDQEQSPSDPKSDGKLTIKGSRPNMRWAKRFYLRGKGGQGPPLGGRNMIRRKGNIIVFGRRYCLSIDKRKADQQLLSSLYYPYLTTIIIEQEVLYFYLSRWTRPLYFVFILIYWRNMKLIVRLILYWGLKVG